MYTQFFVNKSTIKNMEHLLPGSTNHISCNALLLFIFASQELPLYSSVDYLNESCCTVLSKKFKEKFCKALQVNERSYKRNIRELVNAGLLRLVNQKERSYFVNPFLASKIGESDVLKYVREYFSANNIFSGTPSQSAEKYCKLFLTLDNVGKYSAFVYKNINYTELIVFLILAAEARFCYTPNSPEECNKVSLNVQKMEKLASTLNIGVSTLYRTLDSLCKYHFLHKIDGVNGEYIVNPFIAAKGEPAKIEKFRSKILPEYFGKMADGDIVLKSDLDTLTVIAIYKPTGECIEYGAA